MTIGLIAKIEETAGSGVWVTMGARMSNVVGSPVVSATANDDGRALADNYTLDFSNVVVGVSATVTVRTSAPNNPYNNTSASVLLDGVTVYDEIVPGVDLVFID